MKKLLKVILGLLLLLVIAIGGLIAYVKLALPNVGPPPDLKVAATPERIERGKYLANHVSVCIDCHSTRDWTKFSGPPKPGTLGKGGELFDQRYGFPGVYYSQNITPAGIGTLTDGQIFRAMTTGVAHDGHAMFPVMPYPLIGTAVTEDIYCIIAYIRTLAPIENVVPAPVSDFPMSIIINTIPQKFTPEASIPAKTDTVNYGRYMVHISGCHECHTNFIKGKFIEDMAFAGGREFPMAGAGIVRSANLTPDKSGIALWTKEQFIAKFKSYSNIDSLPKVEKGGYNSMMPWTMYAGMHEEDLAAIYKYLQSLKPIHNEVEKWTAAK